MAVDAKAIADCDARLQRRAQVYAQTVGKNSCKVKTKEIKERGKGKKATGVEFTLACEEKCDKAVKTYNLPGDELKACKLAVATIEGVTRRVAERAQEKGKVDLGPAFEMMFGWEPRDFAGPDCKPIFFPELQEFQKCLRQRPRSTCNDESLKVRTVLERSAIGERGKKLGEGDNRSVYALGPKCVIKIAKGRNTTRDNLREVNAWTKIRGSGNKKIIQMFLPVVRADPTGSWIIMPRVQRTTHDDPNFDIEAANQKLRDLGVDCGNIHGDNWGFIGKSKRLVVIDYGHGCRVPQMEERG